MLRDEKIYYHLLAEHKKTLRINKKVIIYAEHCIMQNLSSHKL